MGSSFWFLLLLAAQFTAVCIGRSEYRNRIPNARNVAGVDAVGHLNPKGDGTLNQFGIDFKANGRKWTKVLCNQDSDGDGQSNGQELGDPCCEWVKGSNERLLWVAGVSNPGDATSKSDATQWPNITCGSDSVSDASASVPSPNSMAASIIHVSAAAFLLVVAAFLA